MERVETLQQVLASTLTFDSYRTASNPIERDFYKDRLRLGKIFVVTTLKGQSIFCPSRFAGYEDNTMTKHIAFEYKSGSVTTPRISALLGRSHAKDGGAEKEYLALCNQLGVTPSAKTRTYWTLEYSGLPSPTKKTGAPDPDFPDDVAPSGSYPEGAVTQILVNAYERDPKARQASKLATYGTRSAQQGTPLMQAGLPKLSRCLPVSKVMFEQPRFPSSRLACSTR